MPHFNTPVTLRLEPGRLVALGRSGAVRLRVLTGRAWITQANDLEDHFLQRGEALELSAGAGALVSAEGGEASICFETEGVATRSAGLRRVRDAWDRWNSHAHSGIHAA